MTPTNHPQESTTDLDLQGNRQSDNERAAERANRNELASEQSVAQPGREDIDKATQADTLTDLSLPPRAVAMADFAQEFYPTIPTADGEEIIRIEPAQDERQGLEYLMSHLPRHLSDEDGIKLLKAYLVASYAHRHQKRKTGESYMVHPIAVATILSEMNLDVDTLSAALLHDVVEDTEFTLDYIQAHFGPVIADLVNGVTKLKRINELSKSKGARNNVSDAKAESLRKMFLAMVEDIRVVIIKLADRLHNMRTLEGQSPHSRRRIARETLDIFAPLANRLGIWQMKWELEDLSFRWVQPEAYNELAGGIMQKRSEREELVRQTEQEILQALRESGIHAQISGRPKHIYSIWKKTQRKDVPFDKIYDIHGYRVIVDTEAQCYAALGVIHTLWRPIPGEFDDYIANPKENMYRSLHTAVFKSGKPMEVQIRTREMHEVAELGIAAHWSYKEGKEVNAEFQQKINWLRQLMEWQHDVTDASTFVDGMKTDIFNDRVYVFTPKGDVIDLPAGATPIDLAYAIHTELGHRCRSAMVNGAIVGLDYKLQNSDQVNIVAASRGGPSRDWLNPNLEYIATHRARTKIRSWLRKQDWDENVTRGRQMLDKEMKRLSVTESYESVMKLFKYSELDKFLAAIGFGEVNTQQIAQRLLENERKELEEEEFRKGLNRKNAAQRQVATGSFEVDGVDGLLTHLGRCCNPVPGDQIIGYVTQGRGITVHRKSCPNIRDTYRNGREAKLIDVQWKTQHERTFPVKIQVSAYDRAGLVRDVASLVADAKINMLSVEALTGQKNNMAVINATLEIEDIKQLGWILTQIDRLQNVIDVRRRVG
jgi:RelA/SpoT family (p)ppGpp synthetase